MVSPLASPESLGGLSIEGASPAFRVALQQLVDAHIADVTVQQVSTWSHCAPAVSAYFAPKDRPEGDILEISPRCSEDDEDVLNEFTEHQQQLVNVFHALDIDGNESLTANELRRALGVLGVPNARVGRIIRMADLNRSGAIELHEWKSCVAKHDFDGFGELADAATATLREKILRLEHEDRRHKEISPTEKYVISPSANIRVMWDVLIILLCAFTAIEFPFVFAWEDEIAQSTLNALKVPEITVDVCFLLDIVFNFFTGFYDYHGSLVLDHASVAKNYLQTWFFLDLVSSIPFDYLHPGVNTQMFKVLKFWKCFRVLKMLKVFKSGLDLSGILADMWLSKIQQTVQRRGNIVIYLLLACHWMSCSMKVVDEGFLTHFQNVKGKVWQEYLAALYWAMTTLTTVGYGDITPTTDREILYVIFAMVCGGFFYGYVVGTIASMVASADLNASAYYDRMEIVHAWLTHHGLPWEMKTRLRRYFKALMERRSAADEADLWNELTQELRMEVGDYIVCDTVKANPLFDRLGIGAIVQLQTVLKHVTMDPGQRVTTEGEVGTAMFMIEVGVLQWQSKINKGHGSFGPGESFGEEILLGFKEDYEYTVTMVERGKLEVIAESDFLQVFDCMPRVIDRMRRNALLLNPEWEETDPSADPNGAQASAKDSKTDKQSGGINSKLTTSMSRHSGTSRFSRQSRRLSSSEATTSALVQSAARR